MSDNINSDIRKMAEENVKKFLETRDANKKARTVARKKTAATAALRAAAARKKAAVEAGRARAAAKTMKPKRTPQRPKTESAKRTPQRPKTESAKRTPSPKSGSVYQTPKTSPSPKSRNNNNNLNMESQLEQNQKNSDELEEWSKKNKSAILTFSGQFNKFVKEAQKNTNINITKNNRDLAEKFKPEFQQALRTNNSTNNKRVVNVAIQAAEKKYPTVKWNKITNEIITPMVKEIKDFIARGQLLTALRVIVPLIFVAYLNSINPRFTTLIIQGGIRSLSKYFPFMAPITNKSSEWYKRLYALIIYTSNPTKERTMYDTMMADVPGNKYGRSLIGMFTQFLTIAVTFMMAAIPIDGTGTAQAFYQILLRVIQSFAKAVFNNIVTVTIQGKKQEIKITWQALTAALKFAATGAGATIGGPVGAAGALVTTMVR
jgi:hypothetical protein